MSDEELDAFLAEQRTMQCATNGPRGAPPPDAALVRRRRGPSSAAGRSPSPRRRRTWSATRAPRWASRTACEYQELRGVMFECDVELERDTERVAAFGIELFERYGGGGELAPEAREAVRKPGRQARGPALHAHPDGHLGPPQAGRHVLIEGPDPLRGQGHAPAPDHPHVGQAAGAGGQQAGALLRDRGDGRRRDRRGGHHRRARDRRRDPRRGGRRVGVRRARSPTSTRPSRWAWPTRCSPPSRSWATRRS